MESLRLRPVAPLTAAMVAAAVTACASLTRVGADSRWLAALGSEIVRAGRVPVGVPYAAVDSSRWHNVPVLGELVFYGLERALGDGGLVLAQVAAVAIALWAVARGLRPEAGILLLLVPLAALNAFLVVRSQLFSIALFPLLVLLLHREARWPTRRIWLVVPLVALWSNLHGGVLVGIAVAAAYLLVDRLRAEPLTALGVLAAAGAALLATPAGTGTLTYYRGVLGNALATTHQGYWAPFSPHQPLDVLFLGALVPLVLLAVLGRPRAWEVVGAAGLAAGAALASRNEVWLVLFVAPLAVRGAGRAGVPARGIRLTLALVPLTAAAAMALLVWLGGSPSRPGAGDALRLQAAVAARGTPILADPYDAELLAWHGGRVVIGDPIDAFPKRQQLLYAHWLEGRSGALERLAPGARAVLVTRGAPAQRRLARDRRFCHTAADPGAVLYVRCRRS